MTTQPQTTRDAREAWLKRHRLDDWVYSPAPGVYRTRGEDMTEWRRQDEHQNLADILKRQLTEWRAELEEAKGNEQ